MASIVVNYASMASGHDGLLATWSRIEGHLAELDAHWAGVAALAEPGPQQSVAPDGLGPSAASATAAPDPARILALFPALADFAGTVSQLAWSAWRTIAAHSAVRRGVNLEKLIDRCVAGEDDPRAAGGGRPTSGHANTTTDPAAATGTAAPASSGASGASPPGAAP